MPNLSSVFPELLDGKKDVREKKQGLHSRDKQQFSKLHTFG